MLASMYTAQEFHGERVQSVTTARRHLVRKVACSDCSFDALHLVRPGRWSGRHEFSDVTAVRCSFDACSVEFAELRNVALKECSVGEGGVLLNDCLLRNVTLQGDFGSLRVLPPESGRTEGGEPLADGLALDVRGARFGEVEFLGIRPDAVAYDHAVGGVISRDVLSKAGWPVRGQVTEYFGGIVYKFKLYGGDHAVYIVPTLAPDARMLMHELDDLKKRGWVT
jgi:hypothetical protein